MQDKVEETVVAPQEKTETLQFGQGYNSATGNGYSQALIYNDITDLTSHGEALTVDFYHKEIEKYDQLIKAVSTSANVSGRGQYAGFSASASWQKSKFESKSVSNYSAYLLVKVVVSMLGKFLKTPTLLPRALQLADEAPDTFLRQYGDSYVKEIKFGGELFVLFEFRSRNEEELKISRSAATATANYFGSGGRGGAARQTMISKLNEVSDKEIQLVRKGGVEELPIGELADLDNYARTTFLQDLRSHPDIIEVITVPFNRTFFEETKKVDFNVIRKQQTNKLDSIFNLKLELKGGLANAEYVVDHPEQFDLKDVAENLQLTSNEVTDEIILDEVNRIIEEGNKTIRLLDEALFDCSENPFECEQDFSGIKLPDLDFRRRGPEIVTGPQPKTSIPYKKIRKGRNSGEFYPNKFVSVQLGSIGPDERKKIAFYSEMKYDRHGGGIIPVSLADLCDGQKLFITFRNGSQIVSNMIPVNNTLPIDWLPGTSAEIHFQFSNSRPWGGYLHSKRFQGELFVLVV